MDVRRPIQGYFRPVSGLRRFSVPKTGVFSWALPTKTIPSVPEERAWCSLAMSSLRCPLANVIRGICSRSTKHSTAAMKAVLIGSMSAEEARVSPRWKRKNAATPRSVWSRGLIDVEVHAVDAFDLEGDVLAEDIGDGPW